jgi:DNA-binding response OmpR family regulator
MDERRPAGPSGPRARVLVVLDQPLVAGLIRLALGHGFLEVREATSAPAAVELLATWRPDLLLLDMDLEGVSGARLMEHVGPQAPGGLIPTIALARRGDLRTTLEAFGRGVDDFLALPFCPQELLARVLALLRRVSSGSAEFSPLIRLGDMEIDVLRRIVRSGTEEVHLTPLEQSLLYLLAANADRVVTREEILDALWGPDYVADSNVVDRQVRGLRALLRDDWRKPRFIQTVPGQGYRFIPTASGA